MRAGYNERSWAIDVITEINRVTEKDRRWIRRAGGERTLRFAGGRRFPDVLLFADAQSGWILQGWELKMPDTAISDPAFIADARQKAELLGLPSFLVWNVTTAMLYVQDAGGTFSPARAWELPQVRTRADVELHRARWTALLENILTVLNDYFAEGTLQARTVAEAFTTLDPVTLVLKTEGATSAALQRAAQRDAVFAAQVNLWWRTVRSGYPGEPAPWHALARTILVAWVNRFMFAHYLKRYSRAALRINELDLESSVADAVGTLAAISAETDFLAVLAPAFGEERVPGAAWSEILEFHSFLAEFHFESIDHIVLQRLLEQTIAESRRKAAGQYPTPLPLARLLARVTILDRTGPVLDPACGTGTLLRGAFEAHRDIGIPPAEAVRKLWGSDKFMFPLQFATLALSHPDTMGEVIRVFPSDMVDLDVGRRISFTDPVTGTEVVEALPEFTAIVSNLPFVQFEELAFVNPRAPEINEEVERRLGPGFRLPARSDLYAYLPFHLHKLLSGGGRLGIIVSNSWLANQWGTQFVETLGRFYRIDGVVVSGRGRWFQNADIVTCLLVLTRRDEVAAPPEDERISFATLRRPLSDLREAAVVDEIADAFLLGEGTQDLTVRSLGRADIKALAAVGLQWSSCFADLSWVRALAPSLVPARSFLDIARGERRGWDPMFYPAEGHGIEAEYLRPVLKTSRLVGGLWAEPDADAFCCSRTMEELHRLGHTGAYGWIRRFEAGVNEKGRPLPEVLARNSLQWYEMRDSAAADLVALINPDRRLFVARMRQRGFVNQRLTRMTVRPGADAALVHALLNSVVGLFYLEALGFGRGLGALDLNATKLRDNLFILDPRLLSPSGAGEILAAFQPLLARRVHPLDEELAAADRAAFDATVLRAFGAEALHARIEESLLGLYAIRRAVKED